MKIIISLLIVCGSLLAQTAVIDTNPHPSWGPIQSWKVGGTNGLDGSASVGLTGYQWSCTDSYAPGSTTPRGTCPLSFSSTSVAMPTISGDGAGSFVIQLCDSMGMNCTSANIGEVNYDANGVIIQSDPNVTKIYGPMIAFGQNPWGYQDERQQKAVSLQIANNTYYTSMAAVWSVNGQGTVAYPFAGVGFGQAGASLNGAITSATQTSIPIHNAERITGLASLPTWIWVGGYAGSGAELIRITATTGTSGDQTLTVGYDGRGLSNYPYGLNSNVVAATTWPDATVVGEMRIQGTSTLFATDPQRPLAPAGVPGPPGPVTYSTGTVSVTHSSTTITGSGTTWTSGNGVVAGNMIRVSGTTHGGTAFAFWRQITVVGGTTSLTVDHAYPSDADDLSGLSYKITGARYVSLEFADPTYGGTHFALQNLMGCESETVCFATPAHDLGATFDPANETGMHYSYKSSVGAGNQPFGPNFYGTDSAELSLAERSGDASALIAARQIGDYWIRDPEFCGGYCPVGSPLNIGGGFLGGLANTVLNGSALTSFTDIRPFALQAVNYFTTYHATCSAGYDTRDESYLETYLTLAAIFDPDPTFKASWLAALGSAGSGAGVLGRDNLCKRSDDSFAVTTLAGPVLSFTNGSAVANLVSGATDLHHIGPGNGPLCAGVATGTITVTHGSFAATFVSLTSGTLAGTNTSILIDDTTSSPNYVGSFAFSFSGSDVVLAGKWPGASGTFTYMAQGNAQANTGAITAIGTGDYSSDDIARLTETWACMLNSNTQMTMNRPWDDSVTGGSVHPSGNYTIYAAGNYSVPVAGYYQQPFMYGIKTTVVNWLANYTGNSTLSTGYSSIFSSMGPWMHSVGYDPYTNGVYSTVINDACEPQVAPKSSADPPGSSVFDSINPACGGNGLNGYSGPEMGEYPSRSILVEAFPAIVAYYREQCSLGTTQCDAARVFGDKAYGATWGKCSMTSGGGATFYCDSHYVSDTTGELTDASIGAYKWSGFFFGEGMSYQWPAVRFEGLNPGGTITGGNVTIGAGVTRQ